jgi:hypothetical protein
MASKHGNKVYFQMLLDYSLSNRLKTRELKRLHWREQLSMNGWLLQLMPLLWRRPRRWTKHAGGNLFNTESKDDGKRQ